MLNIIINIPTWLWGFQDKLLQFVLFWNLICELRAKRNKKWECYFPLRMKALGYFAKVRIWVACIFTTRRVFRLQVASLCFIFLDLLVYTLLLLRSVAFYEKRIYPLHHCWSRPLIKVKMAPRSKSRWWSSHGSVSVNYWVPLVFSPPTNPTHHKWSDCIQKITDKFLNFFFSIAVNLSWCFPNYLSFQNLFYMYLDLPHG